MAAKASALVGLARRSLLWASAGIFGAMLAGAARPMGAKAGDAPVPSLAGKRVGITAVGTDHY